LGLTYLPQGTLEDVGDVVDPVGGKVVAGWDGMGWDGDAGTPSELGCREVAFLEPELGPVEGIEVDVGEARAAADPRALSGESRTSSTAATRSRPPRAAMRRKMRWY